MRNKDLPKGASRVSQGGFTLIEVLVAILILAFGLLGYAFLQTMTVRFSQSANQRTQVTNLGSAMLDQMRANRNGGVFRSYLGTYSADTTATSCKPALAAVLDVSTFKSNWSCRMGQALGEGATANVSQSGDVIEVEITWYDERWNQGADNAKKKTFSMESEL